MIVNLIRKSLILSVVATVGIAVTSYSWWIMLESLGLPETARVLIALLTFFGLWIPIPFQLRATKNLSRSATFDTLTGLLNRSAFNEYFRLFISDSLKKGKTFHLLLIDLNKFKHINDTLGHNVGDNVLQIIAHRLKDSTRTEDVVARLGGDEFAILVSNTHGADSYKHVIEKINKNISSPAIVDGHHLHLGVSIGVATYPITSSDPIELMRCADIAMYISKRSKTPYEVYEESFSSVFSKETLDLIGELKTAIEQGDVELWLQPKKNLSTNLIDAAECLVRWNHPIKGIIPPDTFIPAAEAAGMIKLVTQYVIKQATSYYQILKKAGHDLTLSVNISPLDIVDPTMMPFIIKYVDKARMPAEKFCLEITETAIMHDPDSTAKVVTALNSMGIRISIDDFGTGHSSLMYLKKFPLDEVKLDKTFIVDITTNKEGFSIVKSTIDLTHRLNAIAAAEGVEDEKTEITLVSMGCDYIQGYLLAPAMDIDKFIAWTNDYNQNRNTT